MGFFARFDERKTLRSTQKQTVTADGLMFIEFLNRHVQHHTTDQGCIIIDKKLIESKRDTDTCLHAVRPSQGPDEADVANRQYEQRQQNFDNQTGQRVYGTERRRLIDPSRVLSTHEQHPPAEANDQFRRSN